MRSLAHFVMQGRTQAIMVSAFATGSVFFSWIGAAVIALVTLSKGPRQGLALLGWAAIPGSILVYFGEISPLATIIGTFIVSMVLWSSRSWSLSLIGATVSGLITGVLLLTIGEAYLQMLLTMLSDMFAQMQQQAVEQGNEDVVLNVPSAVQIAGLIALSNTMTVIVSLIIGRWWQAIVFNPGGFQREFHALRLSPVLVVILLSLGVVTSTLGIDYRFWAVIFALPFVVAGFSLMHAFVARRQLGTTTLVFAYIAWLLIDVFKVALLLVVIVDSWVDLRKFFSGQPPSNDDRD